MRSIILVACGLAFVPAGALHAADRPVSQQGWSFTLGGGFGSGPAYEGAKKTEFSPVPVAEAQWRSGDAWGTTLFAGTGQGVGIGFGEEDGITFGAAFSYGGGRKEKDDSRLRGLGDVKAGVTGGVFIEVPVGPLGFRIDTQTDLTEDSGTVVNFGVGAGVPITEALSLGANVSAAWADSDHMDAYFSISPRQAARSRAGLRRFDAKAGFKSVSAGVDATYAFNPALSLTLSAGIVQLIGDAAKSPISEKDVQPTYSLTLVYTF
jgi:MipA family protein